MKVDAVRGILTLVAGNGVASSAGDNGPALLASLNGPSGVGVDAAGNLYVSEFTGSRVRRVDAATRIITTVAGSDGSLRLPMGLAVDFAGNLYIADAGNYRVRRVDAITGAMTTVAGTGVNGHSPDGTPATGLSCQVVYTVTTQWNVGFGTAITIKNTGTTPINGWRLTWTWAGNQQITQSWNSNYTQSGANATLTNASWNPTIAVGTTLSGMGFNGSYSGSNSTPAAFYVNGTRCQ